MPASPVDAPVTTKANGSKLDESAGKANGSMLDESAGEVNGSRLDESGEVDDSNPFTLIVSEGESSGEEGEGESTEHRYTKEQETFIQEATSRRTTHSQHCTYTDCTCMAIIVNPQP